MSNTVKLDSHATAKTADLVAFQIEWPRDLYTACDENYQSPMEIEDAATLRLDITLIGLTLLRSHTMTLPLLLEDTTTSHMLLMASAVIGA